jgi:CheY-like chemotaxis protein
VSDPTKSKLSQSITSTKSFGDTAAQLSRNPLGIIALFIVLIYGLAAMVTVVPSSLVTTERGLLIYFLVIFPVLVLVFFVWIVIFKPVHLFSPRDFRDEENYVALVASLTAAAIKSPDGAIIEGKLDVHKIAETARSLAPATKTRPPSNRNSILWVDDQPENNAFERQAFEALGMSFALALSTQQALDLTKGNSFSAIISDMGRREGAQEGYKLLQTLRTQGNVIPFFIYSSSNSAAQRREATKRGAQGSTNDPQELIQMVATAIING